MAIKKIIFVASYPPRKCGIATFTQDLVNSMQILLPDITIEVCALNDPDHDDYQYPAEVKLTIEQDDPAAYLKAANTINLQAKSTLVIVQHEYGIYGGDWGEYVVDFIKSLDCPVITTLHTVIAKPTPKIRSITERIIKYCQAVVTLTDSSLKLLKDLYPPGAQKFTRILHGIHHQLFMESADIKPKLGLANRPTLLTFGLLSRSKGLEFVIRALPEIKQHVPDVLYLIVGGTHPGLIRKEGEAYREELVKLVKQLSLQDSLKFVSGYQSLPTILEYLQATDIYIASSTDPNQTVSGTLSYALGAGRAVISTNFPQAKEIVSNDVGRIVPIADPTAYATATIEMFKNPRTLEAMNHAAYNSTRSMIWSNVADDYIRLLVGLTSSADQSLTYYPPLKWQHLKAMSDGFGLLQFSKGTIPDPASGYTLDDNSRALQVIWRAKQSQLIDPSTFQTLAVKYLHILDECLSHDPAVNYLTARTKRPTKQNLREDLSDSLARAYYALQMVKDSGSTVCDQTIKRLLVKLDSLMNTSSVHSAGQALLGASWALQQGDQSALARVKSLAQQIVTAYRKNYKHPKWRWFDDKMTYASGQLCSSLLDAARLTSSKTFREVALDSLDFLIENCFLGQVYVPIGQNGWLNRDGYRALFDQQPEDVFSMIQALESAYLLTHHQKYISLAQKAFSWFLGNNLVGLRLYDDLTGGCHDGLKPNKINPNEGAESTLSYLAARLTIERLETLTSQQLKTVSRSTVA